MTHENGTPNHPDYELPADQLGFELDLIDRFAAEFPEQAQVLHSGLNDVKRFAGFDIPKYKISDEDAERASENGLTDDLGYMLTSGSPIFSLLMLQMPIKRTPDEIRAMSEPEKTEASCTDDGMTILGDIPEHTSRMIDGLYALTGAKVIRDQRQEGQDKGRVLREGTYQGNKVYFEEMFDEHSPYYGGKPLLKLYLINEQSAEIGLNELNASEFEDFKEKSGLDGSDAWNAITDNELTRHNYEDAADAIRQTKEIVDGAEEALVPEALADTIDGVFDELGVTMHGAPAKIDRSTFKKKIPRITVDKDNNLIVHSRKSKLAKSAKNIGKKMLRRSQ